jgi:hypothetical protein
VGTSGKNAKVNRAKRLKKQQCPTRLYRRVNTATVSMCAVCGNMSTGWTVSIA